MNSSNNTSVLPAPAEPPVRADVRQCSFRNRGLTLATLVIALAGFVGTAFSAVPVEAGAQPGACIGSVLR